MASANGNLKKYGNTKGNVKKEQTNTRCRKLMTTHTNTVDLLSEEQQDVLRNKGSKIERLQSGNDTENCCEHDGSVLLKMAHLQQLQPVHCRYHSVVETIASVGRFFELVKACYTCYAIDIPWRKELERYSHDWAEKEDQCQGIQGFVRPELASNERHDASGVRK